jgi:hypothetical protein
LPIVNRQTEDLQENRSPADAADRFRRLVEGWKAEDPAYDLEVWPELEEALDRNRPEYRKHFPQGIGPRAS